jgi:hypothetical protein
MEVETVNLMLDFVLIAAAVWMVFVIRNIGGITGRAFQLVAWGGIILGFAHILETITFEVLRLDVGTVELLHRTIVLAGIVLIVLGFRRISAIR